MTGTGVLFICRAGDALRMAASRLPRWARRRRGLLPELYERVVAVDAEACDELPDSEV